MSAERHGINATARESCPEAADFSSARRWVQRRVFLVHACLLIGVGLEPTLFVGLALQLDGLGERLDAPVALIELRRLGSSRLSLIPYPVGFDLRRRRAGSQTGPPTEGGTTRAVSFLE